MKPPSCLISAAFAGFYAEGARGTPLGKTGMVSFLTSVGKLRRSPLVARVSAGSERLRKFAAYAGRGVAAVLPDGWRARLARFVKRAGPDPEPEPDAELVALAALQSEIAAIEAGQRLALAEQTAGLWNAMCARFGGIDGYLACQPEERARFEDELARFVERFAHGPASAGRTRVLSARLVLAYARLFACPRDEALAFSFCETVAGLVSEGRRVARITSGEGHAPNSIRAAGGAGAAGTRHHANDR